MRVLSIDPGSIRTGFAVVDLKAGTPRLIGSGTIQLPPKEPLAERLRHLNDDLRSVIEKYAPSHLALESVFFSKNAQSAIHLGHASGVILMRAAVARLEIFEYAPAEVKKSLTGQGRASKDQVERMLRLLLKLPKTFTFSTNDQSDALAIALTHTQSFRWKELS